MPDMTTIVSKLQNNQLQPLKIYPQDAALSINELLNQLLDQLLGDITCGVLASDEIDLCKQIFANAIITNLIDRQAQADLDALFTHTLAGYSVGKLDGVYLSQELKRNHLREPGAKCVYTVTDVSDAARAYDGQKDAQNRSNLLANLGAFYNNMTALILIADDEQDVVNFKSLANPRLQAANMQVIPNEFSVQNKVFDGIMLRRDYKLADTSCDPNSEARIIADVATRAYSDRLLATKTIEAILPSMLVVFNAHKLARATTSELMAAKNDLGRLMSLDKSRVLSFAQMATLGTMNKAIQKMNLMANQLNNVLARSAMSNSTGKFKIASIDMSRVRQKIMRIEKKMKNVDVSKNPTYHNFETFQRANRREPNNPDLPGISMDLGYYPDIHLYVDTSGSITQKDYEDSVSMIIDIAKKLNCDIYFNSFTTDISQEAVVRCRNRSKSQIQRDIERIPKLTGGTTIDQVWQYIDATRKNRRQLSILISDFYVDVPRYLHHPENLYYLPTKDTSIRNAQHFADKLPDPWRVLF